MTKITLLSTALIAAVSAFAGTAALAESGSVTQSQMVRTDDLNLASPAGVAALTQRIRVAARRVCDETSPPVSLSDTCVATAVTQAQAKATAMIASLHGNSLLTVAAVTPGR